MYLNKKLMVTTLLTNLSLVADLPGFGKPLNNLTISVGREAIFVCIVENLGGYKVRKCFVFHLINTTFKHTSLYLL